MRAILVILVLLAGCAVQIPPEYRYSEPILSSKAVCHWRVEPSGYLPDATCTGGDVFDGATAEVVCVKGYAGTVRNVSGTLKEQVYADYGILLREKGQYEVDHLIPLHLGGSNEIENLWPMPTSPYPATNEKDKATWWLHQKVCAGEMGIAEAQRRIAENWSAVYWEMMG